MNSLILFGHKIMNCSFKEEKSLKDSHICQDWLLLSVLDAFQYILFWHEYKTRQRHVREKEKTGHHNCTCTVHEPREERGGGVGWMRRCFLEALG